MSPVPPWAGINLRSVASVRYQYRLVGIDHDWSHPVDTLSVNYASLPAGHLQFDLRAVTADAAAVAAPLFWYLNAQVQSSGFAFPRPAITGYFTYDAATGFSTNWNFRADGNTFLSGPFPPSCPPGDCHISSSSFDPTTHSVGYQTCFLAAGICYPTEVGTASGNVDDIFSFSEGHQTSTVLHLDLTQPLTDAGGTIPLIPAAPCMPGAPPVCEPNSPGSYIGETFAASPSS